VSRPVFAAPAEIELDLDPIRPDWVIEGTPQVRSKYLARSADGASSVMAWSCTAGRFIWCYKVDEMLHVISGEVFVTDENGAVRHLGPGDMAFFPAGARSVWHVPHEVRKLAMCRHKMPQPFGIMVRAWNNLIDRLTGFSAVEGKALDVRSAARPPGGQLASV
jgi:uncharacterized cupin superfamily protein